MSEEIDDQALADEWAAALSEQDDEESAPKEDKPAPAAATREIGGLQVAAFDELTEDAGGGDSVNLDSILDVPVTISMEIGRTRINIRNLLQLNQGSVVELDRVAGEPMDVLVNGTLIAQGEVVVVNEKFGIRLTDVVSPADRIRRLGK
jgi:flagellar motor switch protein FliN/FliY